MRVLEGSEAMFPVEFELLRGGGYGVTERAGRIHAVRFLAVATAAQVVLREPWIGRYERIVFDWRRRTRTAAGLSRQTESLTQVTLRRVKESRLFIRTNYGSLGRRTSTAHGKR